MELRFRTDDHRLYLIVKGKEANILYNLIRNKTVHVYTDTTDNKNNKAIILMDDFKLTLSNNTELMLYKNYYVVIEKKEKNNLFRNIFNRTFKS